jgi:hypothetical protein
MQYTHDGLVVPGGCQLQALGFIESLRVDLTTFGKGSNDNV